MSLIHDAAVGFGKAIRSVHAGEDKLASRKLGLESVRRLQVTSPVFTDGGGLPLSATADGGETPPRLDWSPAPSTAQSIVVLVEDPDAPFPQPFVHWLVYALSPRATTVDPDHYEGKNSKLSSGFTGAAPPAGHGLHHYHFQVFALDVLIAPGPGMGRSALLDMMRDHVVAWGELVGTYERAV